MASRKILFIITSNEHFGASADKKTGVWLEELAAPYYAFVDAGCQVVLASPRGGRPPVDPMSEGADSQTDATRRFTADVAAQEAFGNTLSLDHVSSAEGFAGLFFPGGHGPLWDLRVDVRSIALIESFAAANLVIGSVCHGPTVLVNARKPGTAEPLVAGKRVTAFTNAEEEMVGLTKAVPIALESALVEKGAHFVGGPAWASHAIVDGLLVTGQNPASSHAVAAAMLGLMSA